MKTNDLYHKHRDLAEKIYKSYEKYISYCAKMDILLKNEIISNYDEEKPHLFYVGYSEGDGLALYIDLGISGITPSVCNIDAIIGFFLSVERKLTIREIIEVSSF